MSESGSVPLGARPSIESASQEARNLLERTLQGLRETQAAGADKFFPNGIELIHIKVEAGLTETTKVGVELKIAGPKGVEAGESASDAVRLP